MKNKQQGFIGVVVIILITLAVIAGGAYVYTQKESSKTPADNILTTSTSKTVTVKNEPVVKTETKVEVKTTITQKVYVGASYGFSYPSDWDIWEANPVIGLTIAYPKSKADQVMNNTISATDRINISLIDNKYVDLTGATKVTLNGEVWYMKIYKGPFDGGSENVSVSYFKIYNSTKYVTIDSGMSNKATVELIAMTWKQG